MKAKANINKRRPEKQYKKSFSQKQSVNLFADKQQNQINSGIQTLRKELLIRSTLNKEVSK